MSAENPTFSPPGASPYSKRSCLLCRIDADVPDPAVRAMACMGIADMANLAAGVPWQEYTNCCRKHAMQSIEAIKAMNMVFINIMKEDGAPPEVVEASKRMVLRQVIQLEAAIIAKYDRRTE